MTSVSGNCSGRFVSNEIASLRVNLGEQVP